MTFVSESIEVAVPAEQVFSLFSETSEIPNVIGVVSAVEPISDDEARWTIEVLGQRRTIRTRVAERVPGERMKWVSASDSVDFSLVARTDALTPASTRVTLEADFNVGGVAEKLGLAKGPASIAISKELKNAKKYAEGRFPQA